jgi:hypothetical protein
LNNNLEENDIKKKYCNYEQKKISIKKSIEELIQEKKLRNQSKNSSRELFFIRLKLKIEYKNQLKYDIKN